MTRFVHRDEQNPLIEVDRTKHGMLARHLLQRKSVTAGHGLTKRASRALQCDPGTCGVELATRTDSIACRDAAATIQHERAVDSTQNGAGLSVCRCIATPKLVDPLHEEWQYPVLDQRQVLEDLRDRPRVGGRPALSERGRHLINRGAQCLTVFVQLSEQLFRARMHHRCREAGGEGRTVEI